MAAAFRLSLSMAQQPLRARMSGFALRDRRPLDPPPICRLEIAASEDGGEASVFEAAAEYLVYVSLWSADMASPIGANRRPSMEDGGSSNTLAASDDSFTPALPPSTDVPASSSFTSSSHTIAGLSLSPTEDSPNESSAIPKIIDPALSGFLLSSAVAEYHHVIMGCLVSPCYFLRDLADENGFFFVFPDISIRTSGFYRLKLELFRMTNGMQQTGPLASVFTDPFNVYSPKTFPGMSESTALSKKFAKQGVRIHIRPNGGQGDGVDFPD